MKPTIAGTSAPQATFREGDEVVLAKGTYQGTPGVFLRLRDDANWADIKERNGSIRNHPLVWLAHSTPSIRPVPSDGGTK